MLGVLAAQPVDAGDADAWASSFVRGACVEVLLCTGLRSNGFKKTAKFQASFLDAFGARRSLAIAFGLRALASSVGNFGVCRLSVF